MKTIRLSLAVLTFQSMFSEMLLSAAEGFVERFNGRGEYASVELIDSQFLGLDNPDWRIYSDGFMREDGFHVVNDPRADTAEWDSFSRQVLGSGNFVERVEINDVYLAPVEVDGFPSSSSGIFLGHHLDLRSIGDNRLAMWVTEADSNTEDWLLGISASGYRRFERVPSGTHVALEIRYNDDYKLAMYSFDNNVDDESPGVLFGPLSYTRSVDDSQLTSLSVQATGFGASRGILDFWSLTPLSESLAGDFSFNGVLDIDDIDLISHEVREGTFIVRFDLNSNGVVDGSDRQYWVEELRNTYFGDANLDGQFNSLDLVTVFQAAEYEDAADGNSTWRTGDWTGDGDFSSRDLVLAFQSGGYEAGPRAATHNVPEPTTVAAWVAIAVGMMVRRTIGYVPGRTSKHCRCEIITSH